MQVSTVLKIKKLKAEGYYSISGSRGLQLRVTKYGKEFYFRYSLKGKRHLFKIGTSDLISLSDARKKLLSFLSLSVKEQIQKNKRPLERKNAPLKLDVRHLKNVPLIGSKKELPIIFGKTM